ncbi:MAG TPA: LysM peptidoglycan-binding domain-containing protein [Acidimicrobiia bacterium]|nr:LysM peptidoglycan-binding domain-containing protein [Acidimicrobiia bacterium]
MRPARATWLWGRQPTWSRLVAASGLILLVACGTARGDRAKDTPGDSRPTATTVAPTAPAPASTPYQVKRGDTLTSIARFFGMSSQTLAAVNQLDGEAHIKEGQVLQIPPAPPAGLAVSPPDGISGSTFTFTVTGAKVGETVTFQIAGPRGKTYNGSPHRASNDGVVTASYMSSGDDPGTYAVVATGDRGTSLRAEYRLLG